MPVRQQPNVATNAAIRPNGLSGQSGLTGAGSREVKTPVDVKPAEVRAAQQLKSQVGLQELDAFLKVRSQATNTQRSATPTIAAYLAAPVANTPPTPQAKALHEKLSAAIGTLGGLYADGLITEGETHQLNRVRGALQDIIALADPRILQMLPKDVRERVEVQLLEPLQTLEAGAARRFDRVFVAMQERDEGVLRGRLQQEPSYSVLDVAGLKAHGMEPSSTSRYQAGDFVCVPRSDGSHSKGVVVGHEGGDLQVQLIDGATNSFALKNLKAADVARANPLKIGDYAERQGHKVWVTGAGAQGLTAVVVDPAGRQRQLRGAEVATLAKTLSTPAPTTSAPPTATSSTSSSSPVGAAFAASSSRTSRQSLEQALDAVWADRGSFSSGAKNVYSDIYNAVADTNQLTRPKGAYLTDLANLAASRPAGSTSNTQSFGGSGDSISSVVTSWQKGELPAEGMFSAKRFEGTFFRFERPDWQPNNIKQRVYLNTAADHATDVMRFVVQQILDNPAAFPGVEMTKLSGPSAVGARSENIVLYTSGDDASRRVLDAVGAYQANHPQHFMKETPAFTETVAPGIATGDEPAIGGGRLSFGSLRADVIEGALRSAKDRKHFGALVDAGLKQSQVDPQRPHKNLVVSRGLT